MEEKVLKQASLRTTALQRAEESTRVDGGGRDGVFRGKKTKDRFSDIFLYFFLCKPLGDGD